MEMLKGFLLGVGCVLCPLLIGFVLFWRWMFKNSPWGW